MDITRQSLENFRGDFKDAVAELEAKYGVKISIGSLTYDSTMFRGKMTATKRSEGFVAPSANAPLESYIGSKVSFNGTNYEVTGVKANRPKYPLVMVREGDGKQYKVSVEQVRNNII